MKHLLLPLSFCATIASAQNTYDISVSDLGFTPDSLSIQAGDSIRVTFYDMGHTFWQVSQQTWLSDSSTMSGLNFEPSFVGESFTVALMIPDTFYYVCATHVEMNGEKGYIIIQPATGVLDHAQTTPIRLWPNPVTDAVNVVLPTGGLSFARVFDAQGRQVMNAELDNRPLNVWHLGAGSYTMVCLSHGGETLAREVFTVVH